MKIKIETGMLAYACGMVHCITNRDQWTGEQTNGFLALSFKGKGRTIQGREVSVEIDIDGDRSGGAVMEVDAPGSQGGFLGTLLEEMLGQHKVRRDGERPSESAELPGLSVVIDGEPAVWEWIEIECGGTWWRTARKPVTSDVVLAMAGNPELCRKAMATD